jgi:hypothetical protein
MCRNLDLQNDTKNNLEISWDYPFKLVISTYLF